MAGLARQVAPDGVTINNLLLGTFTIGRLTSNLEIEAKTASIDYGVYVESRR